MEIELKLPLRYRIQNFFDHALGAWSRSRAGWLLWNPIFKIHRRTWSPASRDGGSRPYVNSVASPHAIASIVSVFGWGYLYGYLKGDDGLLVRGTKTGLVRMRWWGRVELRES